MKLAFRSQVKKLRKKKQLKPLLFVGAFGLLGAAVLILTFAATANYSIEPETSSLDGGASVVADANASGGSAVKFTQTVAGACAVSTPNVPDGPDPWGGCWPGDSNTGVPAGTTLSNYTGSCNVTTPNTIIDSKTINCPDGMKILTTGVIIRKSKVNGYIWNQEGSSYSFTLEDSDVDGQNNATWTSVNTTNFTILRSNIQNAGQTLVFCYHNCVMRDSWLHGLHNLPTGETHIGAFLANDDGGDDRLGDDPTSTTTATLSHNVIHCDAIINVDGGGCSGDINLFGDFGPIGDVTVEKNLIRANVGISFCIYAGTASAASGKFMVATNVVFRDNIIERGSNNKCGQFGPVSGFDYLGPGAIWTNNRWSDGTLLLCDATHNCN